LTLDPRTGDKILEMSAEPGDRLHHKICYKINFKGPERGKGGGREHAD